MSVGLLALPALAGLASILWIATRLERLVEPPVVPAYSVAPDYDGQLAAGFGNTAA